MRALAFAICLLSSALAPRVAEADERADQQARELYVAGARAYDEGRYEEAVTAWKQAYELSPRPLLLFNMANALERLGRAPEALAALQQYRGTADASEFETLDRRIESLGRRVEEQRQLERREKDRQAAADESERRARDAEARVLETEARAQDAEARQRAAAEQAATARAAKSAKPHPVPLVLLGAGLGTAGAGAVLGGLALSARQDAGNLCHEGTKLCPQSAQTAVDRDRTLSMASDVLLFSGIGVATAGLVTTLVDAAQRDKARAPTVALFFGPGGVAFSLEGRLP